MTKVALTLATTPYDHVADRIGSRIPIEGIDLTALLMQTEEVFFWTAGHSEFDISEMLVAKYISCGRKAMIR